MNEENPPARMDAPAQTTTETGSPRYRLQELAGRGDPIITVEQNLRGVPEHVEAEGERVKHGKSPRPAEHLLVERWYGGLREILGDILNDAVITAVILGILHLLHLYISILSFDKWFVDTVDKIHKWSAIIVLLQVSINFILKVYSYTLQKSVPPLFKREGRDERQKG